MRDAPLVSIGVPVYNGEPYIRAALNSLVAQDVGDFEIIVSDNGSQDRTERICREIVELEPRVTYFRSEQNRGAAWNYNRTFELARGKYFKWAAHDDLCDPTFVSKCVRQLEERLDASLSHPNTVRIDGDGCEVQRDPPTGVATQGQPRERVRSLLMNPTPCFEIFGVMRRSTLARTSLIAPYTSSDRNLLLQLALRGPFVVVDEYLFYNRQHEARSIHRFKNTRDRARWFDTNHSGVLGARSWRLLNEYTRSIGRAPLPAKERRQALLVLPGWCAANGGQMLREAARYGVDAIREGATRRRRSRRAAAITRERYDSVEEPRA